MQRGPGSATPAGPNTWGRPRDGARSAPIAISPYDASPGLFGQGNGLAAALNQDGTLNTFDNPVAPGEVIVLYGSGGGPAEPPATDGQLVSGPLQELTLPVSLTIGGEPAEIIYAGSAPGLIAGVVQVNATHLRLPKRTRSWIGNGVGRRVAVHHARGRPRAGTISRFWIISV